MNGNPFATRGRWFTCTPVAFGGGSDFFARDSGLLCRGFQSHGIESRAVMPGEARPSDEADLIRTPYPNLESAEWWKSHGLEGVVLYAWGSPCFRKVARAIREAGVFLILNQDNGGLISPLADFREWSREQAILSGTLPGHFAKVLRGLTWGLAVTDPLRAAHLRQGDVIACVSPVAAEFYRKVCLIYGGRPMSDRVRILPHPVESLFRYDGAAKERQIITVGRWDDAIQKRPQRLTRVAEILLEADSKLSFTIVGTPTSEMERWHAALPEGSRSRVDLAGRMERDSLACAMGAASIFYSPSAYESFGIAAAEALCGGCSVVSSRSVSMASFGWFVSEKSGCLAEADTEEAHVAAILGELRRWDDGERDASMISTIWTKRLHAHNVATAALDMAYENPAHVLRKLR